MISQIYNLLVNRVPGIHEKYMKQRNAAKGPSGRIYAWLYLLSLNVSYYVFRNRKLEQVEKYPFYEEKILLDTESESALSFQKSPEEWAEKLSRFDVVSFDVFDTLVLRPFSSPTDLFYWLGYALHYPDFKRIRREMEQKARNKKYKLEKHYEVTIDEIYEIMERETGIAKEAGIQEELRLENQFCFANPFMMQVVQLLVKKGKRIIITSDMYLNGEQIRTLLANCGYPQFQAYYVSSDLNKSKSQGDLFDYIKEKETSRNHGETPQFVHVGDNQVSDVKEAEKHGFSTLPYRNVNAVGEPYRPYDMSVITGGLYRGIVNAHIHNGLHCFTREYEYGYIYGGLFVSGYCQFIHDYVKENHVDKILFLARDGDVLSKAYQIMYPEETGKCEYVYWSRLAATKMSASYFKYDYFRRFLYHKVNQKYPIRAILRSMELEDLLGPFCEMAGLSPEDQLTDSNVNTLKHYLCDHWDEVLAHYQEQLAAGKIYFGKILSGSRKAVAVDIGWAGSGAITLDHIVNHIWGLGCDIIGLIAGTDSCYNAEPDTSIAFLQSGKLVSYMYSQQHNRDIWKLHNPNLLHNLYWEILLDAPMGSFIGFYPDGAGGVQYKFKEPKADTRKIEEIQSGILDFVKEYAVIQNKNTVLAHISGRDAYAPMVLAENKKNESFMKQNVDLMDEVNVG